MLPARAKSLSLFVLTVAACSPTTSTETGNPLRDPPAAPLTKSLQLSLELSNPVEPFGVATISSQVSRLWLNLAELEFVTCASTSAGSDLSTQHDWQRSSIVDVRVPVEPVCGLLVRTRRLEPSSDPELPEAAVGKGALLEGFDADGLPFSVTVPEGVFSVLVPLDSQVSFEQLETAVLKVDATGILDVIAARQATTASFADIQADPTMVAEVAARLDMAFSLVATEQAELMAAATEPSEASDVLCASTCSASLVVGCVSECSVDECLTTLADVACGESFAARNRCVASVDSEELSCADSNTSTTSKLSTTAERCQEALVAHERCLEGT